MSHPILQWPDKRLLQRAEPVTKITPEILALWEDMIATMDAMPGVGLAATQLGVALRLCVVDASDERGRAVRMANPEIIDASSDMNSHTEASPCLPGVSAKVTRPAKVLVRFMNEQGQYDRRDCDGLWATSVQHQIDHLNGKMYFHNLSRTKRDMLLKKAQKLR